MVSMARRSGLLCLALFAFPLLLAAEEDPFPGATFLDREALLAAVAGRNPDLAAARLAWQATRERAPQESALADPAIRYEIAPLSLGAGAVPFGQALEVRQAFPWPGVRQARGAAATFEAEAALQDSQELLLALRAEASRLFDDWYLVHRALEVNERHRALLLTFREAATARYAAGLAGQQEPLQAEVETAGLLQDREDLEAERAVIRARLNALLHRPPELSLPPPPDRLPEPLSLEGDVAALQEAAVTSRPELAGLDARIRTREAARDLALLARRPEIDVMGSYNSMWTDPEHRFMAGVAVGLPIRRAKITAARTEAETRLAEARTARESAEMRIRAEVQEAAERYAASVRRLASLRAHLLPATHDLLRAARTGFETGGSLLALIEAERSLRDAELREHEVLAECWRRRATLDRVQGGLP